MKRIHKILAALPLVVALSACVDTSDLYQGNAYVGQVDFTQNRYHTWPDSFRAIDADYSKALNNEEHGFFNGSGDYSAPSKCYGIKQARQWHEDYFVYDDNGVKRELQWVDPIIGSDIINGGVTEHIDQSPLYPTVYSQNKKLSRLHSGFSRGYLSKLYNGQVRCNGWSFYSLVLIDKEGYGTTFPSELSEAEYFAFSARGGRNSDDGRVGNVVSFDIEVGFYRYKADGKTLSKEQVILTDVKLQANFSSEYTSLVGFTFADAGINPKGIIGMSMRVVGMDDPYMDDEGNISSYDFTDDEYYHTGLCLLEVLIPDSKWY